PESGPLILDSLPHVRLNGNRDPKEVPKNPRYAGSTETKQAVLLGAVLNGNIRSQQISGQMGNQNGTLTGNGDQVEASFFGKDQNVSENAPLEGADQGLATLSGGEPVDVVCAKV